MAVLGRMKDVLLCSVLTSRMRTSTMRRSRATTLLNPRVTTGMDGYAVGTGQSADGIACADGRRRHMAVGVLPRRHRAFCRRRRERLSA